MYFKSLHISSSICNPFLLTFSTPRCNVGQNQVWRASRLKMKIAIIAVVRNNHYRQLSCQSLVSIRPFPLPVPHIWALETICNLILLFSVTYFYDCAVNSVRSPHTRIYLEIYRIPHTYTTFISSQLKGIRANVSHATTFVSAYLYFCCPAWNIHNALVQITNRKIQCILPFK